MTDRDPKCTIDELARDVKQGAALIVELERKLKQVETEVLDAFAELEKTN